MKNKEKREGFLSKFIEIIIGKERYIEEILSRPVIAHGTGAKISMPKKHLGKDSRVIVLKNKGRKKKEENISN